MDNREKLLHAAGRIYAEVGFRGATTRRIADEAGVNEVTLFRLFGSKSQLIAEAINCQDPMGAVSLPRIPVDPWRELNDWCAGHATALREMRATIRKTMADLEEHPDMGPHLCRGQTVHFNELVAYAQRLVALHPSVRDADVATSCSMLFSALFGDAMGRDIMPMVYPQPEEGATARYVETFLRSIGVAPSSASGAWSATSSLPAVGPA
ncbi:MAG: TetR/AcrR family transcriptional regulator [Gemmatimonadetes bacterium]|nr:TetR/AcrR family transcriptional regulator [Gemmatimonadota bacterium]MCC6770790.1 TetR/AcrR family transcriptional regulator [Gemmatimonadaceae bacterium]